jgi:hypothetical protein
MTPCRSLPIPGAEGAPAPGPEGTGKARERPATGHGNHPLASELPPPTGNPGLQPTEPQSDRKDSNPAATRADAVTVSGDALDPARYGVRL